MGVRGEDARTYMRRSSSLDDVNYRLRFDYIGSAVPLSVHGSIHMHTSSLLDLDGYNTCDVSGGGSKPFNRPRGRTQAHIKPSFWRILLMPLCPAPARNQDHASTLDAPPARRRWGRRRCCVGVRALGGHTVLRGARGRAARAEGDAPGEGSPGGLRRPPGRDASRAPDLAAVGDHLHLGRPRPDKACHCRHQLRTTERNACSPGAQPRRWAEGECSEGWCARRSPIGAAWVLGVRADWCSLLPCEVGEMWLVPKRAARERRPSRTCADADCCELLQLVTSHCPHASSIGHARRPQTRWTGFAAALAASRRRAQLGVCGHCPQTPAIDRGKLAQTAKDCHTT